MMDELRSTDVPLVLHVIPTSTARGAQREARALADHLDSPDIRLHRVLSLFGGTGLSRRTEQVPVDASLGYGRSHAPAVGFDPRVVLRLRPALDRMDPEVVVAHGSEPLKYLVPALFGRHRPIVYYAIGTYSGSDNPIQLRLWRYLMGRADVVAACGEEVLDECVDRMGVPTSRVTLAANGRDPELFHPRRGEPRRVPVVVFVGALTEGKCPHHFVDMVAELRAGGASLEARVIGDGPLRPALVGPAEKAGVALLGSRSDMADQMRNADILVFPSRPAGEGLPGVLIEAGLSGLPVVATAAPGVRSIVADGATGLVVPVDDLSAMVSATARLLDDPALRASMGHAARRHCEDSFSLAAVGPSWMAILQPLLDSRANGRHSTAERLKGLPGRECDGHVPGK